MNATLRLNFIGRFGNQMFQYASARSACERYNWELRCHMWPGKLLFAECASDPEPDGSEDFIHIGKHNGYCQHQDDIALYTLRDCLRWFKLHPDVEAALNTTSHPHHEEAVAHRRVGDYANLGYAVVSEKAILDSYAAVSRDWLCSPVPIALVTEESPTRNLMFPDWAAFAPDFYRLMTARYVWRANSSFSWWASALNAQAESIYSPIVTGLKGGKEYDCAFVEGNAPRFCDLPGTSDLHLPP